MSSYDFPSPLPCEEPRSPRARKASRLGGTLLRRPPPWEEGAPWETTKEVLGNYEGSPRKS